MLGSYRRCCCCCCGWVHCPAHTLDKRPDMMFRSVLGPSMSVVLVSALAALVRVEPAGVRLGGLRCPKRR